MEEEVLLPELTAKAQEVLKKAHLTDHAITLLSALRFMTHWADECNIRRVINALEGAYGFEVDIINRLDKYVDEGKISWEEESIVSSELDNIRRNHINITIHKLKEKCGCKFREPYYL